MGVAQVWRLNTAGTALVCKGRPPLPLPVPGTSRYDRVTRVRGISTFAPPAQFVIGTTKPDETNTGATGNLTRFPASGEGDLVITTAGTVIENRDIYGYVLVRAANVTIRNCRVRGRGTGYVAAGLIDFSNSAATGGLVEFCTIQPASNTTLYFINAVKANNGLTVRRCNWSRTVDGVNYALATGSMTVEGNWAHKYAFYDNDNDHASSTPPYWTHNDLLCQISGGSGHIVRGNNAQVFAATDTGMPGTLTANGYPALDYGCGITISPDRSPVTNVLITLNWLDGGTASFQSNALYAGTTSANLGEISYNRFGMGQHDFGNNNRYQIRYKTGLTITGLTTNVWDTTASVPAVKQGATLAVGFQSGIRVDN